MMITPAMIKEAVRVLWKSGRLKYEAEEADDLLVEEMLRQAWGTVGWKPIDTAPPSGFNNPRHYVLVRGPLGMRGTDHFVVKAYYDAEYRPRDPWRMVDNSALSDLGWIPTEWMEIPE